MMNNLPSSGVLSQITQFAVQITGLYPQITIFRLQITLFFRPDNKKSSLSERVGAM